MEIFMKPLGKTMKTAKQTNMSEKDSLQHLLNNYRNTPRPTTDIPPAAMLFRDGQRSVFSRTSVTQEAVDQARIKVEACKLKREEGVNTSSTESSKFRGRRKRSTEEFQENVEIRPALHPWKVHHLQQWW